MTAPDRPLEVQPATGPNRKYPPIYPFSFYHSRNFRSANQNALGFLPIEDGQVSLQADTQLFLNRLLSEFDRVHFERSGILLGEYVVLEDGLFLMDRKGTCISINFPWESSLTGTMPFEAVNRRDFWDRRRELVETWDQIPSVDQASIFSHIYHSNYYHFSHEFIQNFRLIEPYNVKSVIVPAPILSKNFQIDLIKRVMGDRMIVPADRPFRVVDPPIVQTFQSYEGLRWLRRKVGTTNRPGPDRVYVRRSPEKVRNGNNIAETPEFMSFLDRHGFRIIDFGNGEHSIDAQIRMLDGAGVVLAAHGAGLTNLGYLNPPLTVIEIFSPSVLSTSFLQIAICLGFRYFGFIWDQADPAGDIVPDVDRLESVLRDIPA